MVPMDQNLPEMINECVKMQDEIGLLTPIILCLSPSIDPERMAANGIPKASQKRFDEKLKELMDLEKVKLEYAHGVRKLSFKLSHIAEKLEEEDFEVERLRPQLSRDQFAWIQAHKKDLKKHLKGIEI